MERSGTRGGLVRISLRSIRATRSWAPAVSEREAVEARPPRATAVLFGHGEAEGALLAAYRGGRLPHAWLVGGPNGIGKATLAYRMARFILAHPDPGARSEEHTSELQSQFHLVCR